MKILVIDDEEDIRRTVCMSLARVGKMEVSDAATGIEGLELARQERPDAVLLDVMMPGMDGTAVLAALRKDPMTAEIPVIFLTAGLAPGELLRLQSLGAMGIIAKPFDPMTLSLQIKELLA